MARQQVVNSECDRCHTEETEPLASGIKNGKYVLPKGWLHVEANTSKTTVFEIDLCETCKVTVLEAAGQAHRNLRVVPSTA